MADALRKAGGGRSGLARSSRRPPPPPCERTEDRAEAKAFYKRADWRRTRAAVLAANPLCVACEARGRVELAVDVHHKQERRDRPDLAFDASNLEGLCKSCHSMKKAK